MNEVTRRNVDNSEVAKFNALAERWWDPNSEFRPLHDINPLRLNYIDERVDLPGKHVIDIGCGGGLLSEGMARRGATVTGIESCVSWSTPGNRHSTADGPAPSVSFSPIATACGPTRQK